MAQGQARYMDQEQASARLEITTQVVDHLLAQYGEKPSAASDGEWLKLIAAQARELVRAASDYLDCDHAPQQAAAHTCTGREGRRQWPPTRRQQPT